MAALLFLLIGMAVSLEAGGEPASFSRLYKSGDLPLQPGWSAYAGLENVWPAIRCVFKAGAESPRFLDYRLPFDPPLVPGKYRVYLRNLNQGKVEVILGGRTELSHPLRNTWSAPVVFQLEQPASELIIRYHASKMTARNYFLQGVFITNRAEMVAPDDQVYPLAEWYGPPAPGWLRASEQLAIPLEWWAPSAELRKLFSVETHVPESDLAEVRAAGRKVVPYLDNPAHFGIDFHELERWAADPKDTRRGRWGNWQEKRPTREELAAWRNQPLVRYKDFSDRPELFFINSKGERKYKYGTPEYVGHYYGCLKSPGYVDAYLGMVNHLLKLGSDGIFIDNIGAFREECFGDTLGQHRHADSRNGADIFFDVLTRVYRTVKAGNPDRVVMFNNHARTQYWKYADAMMDEDNIEHQMTRSPESFFEFLEEAIWKHQEAVEQGKAVVWMNRSFAKIQPRLTDGQGIPRPSPGAKDWGMLCYAAAMVGNFLWCDTYRLARAGGPDDLRCAREIYALRLGEPGPLKVENELWTRGYRNGMAVINPTGTERELLLPGRARVFDLYANRRLEAGEGGVRLLLPPYCGRVFSYPAGRPE